MYEFEKERRENTTGAEGPRPAATPAEAPPKAVPAGTAAPDAASPVTASPATATSPAPESTQPASPAAGYPTGAAASAATPPVGAQQPAAPVQSAPRYGQPGYNTQSGVGYYGAYYNGPYYNSQQSTGGFHSPAAQPGWASTHSVPATQGAVATAPAKPRKGPSRVLAGIAFLLVAALCGFGGGYVANLNSQGSTQTVVYRSAEGTTADRTASVSNLSVSDIAAAASESVVSITTENIVTNAFMGGQVQASAGSGVIISEDGYIITNNHVIADVDNIIVILPDGTDIEATLVGADATSDIAVLKVDATGLVPAVLGDSDVLEVGDMCLAIGNPMGTLGGTVTDGIISAKNREITIDNSTMNLLQMSAAVSPGNSGGGLFNANAELVGIVNAKSGGEGTEGLGFAIPVNTAIKVAEDLINLGYVSGRPALGVLVQEISSAEQALQYGVGALGVYISEVSAGGAAEAGGLQAGDMFISFNGREVASNRDLTAAIQEVAVGDSIEVVVSRGGEHIALQVTMQERVE